VVEIGPNGHWLAAANYYGQLYFWDLSASDEVHLAHSFKGEEGIASISLSMQGAWAAIAYNRGALKLFNMEGGRQPETLLRMKDGIERAVFADNGRILVVKTGTTSRRTESLDHYLVIFAFAPNEGADSLREIARIPAARGELFISESGRFIAHATHESKRHLRHRVLADDALSIYDLSAKDIAGSRQTLDGPIAISDLVFSADDERIAALNDGKIYIWGPGDWRDAEPVVLSGSESFSAMAFDPKGRYFAAGSGTIDRKKDAMVHLWGISEPGRSEPRRFTLGQEMVSSVAFLSGGRLFAGDYGQRFRIFSIDPARIVEAGCSASTRNLSLEEWRANFGAQAYRSSCPQLPPHPSYVKELVAQALELVRVEGDVGRAFAILDQNDLKAHVERTDVSKRFADVLAKRSADFVNSLQIDPAIQSLDDALALNAEVSLSYKRLNDLCHIGAIYGEADRVSGYCDLAMAKAPQREQGRVADARAIARTLRGDYQGAVQDFERFIAFAGQRPGRFADRARQRQQWVERLKAGQNPLDEQEIFRMREQVRAVLF